MTSDVISQPSESPWETERRQRAALDADKRLAIVRTATIFFARRGYHDTSMDDIAGELGVFKPTLYKFFKSKKKLFEACVDQAVEIWLEAAERALAHDGTAAERLGIYLKRNFEFCATDFGKAIMRLDLKEISPTAEQHMRDMRTRIDLIFREIIGDGVDAGEIAAGFEPKLVSFALFGSFNFVAQWYKPDGEFSADEILDQYFRMFFSGLSPRA